MTELLHPSLKIRFEGWIVGAYPKLQRASKAFIARLILTSGMGHLNPAQPRVCSFIIQPITHSAGAEA